MPILTIPKTYRTNEVLTEGDLDNIRSSLLTFFNTTKLDSSNLQIDSIIAALTTAQVGTILDKANSTAVTGLLSKASQSAAETFWTTANIYSTNSSQIDNNYSLTSSFVTRITYTFPATGTYFVCFGSRVLATVETEVRVLNDGTPVSPTLTSATQTVVSFTTIVSGSSGTDLVLQARRTAGSGGTISSYLQVIRVA